MADRAFDDCTIANGSAGIHEKSLIWFLGFLSAHFAGF
jgi:hypothetical protein